MTLDNLKGIERFRISSIEPNLLSDEIISFCADSNKFDPHFHIPLQSGADSILQNMKRRYNTDLYKSKVEYIKQLIPDCCIGVDVIVGYPGEEEEHFGQIRKMPKIGISSYDPVIKKYAFFHSLYLGTERTYEICAITLKGLHLLIVGKGSKEDLGGPLKIAQISGKYLDAGVLPFFYLMVN